ncbi:unnamed protein product [Ambrosiozyma monospora]|uniref:ubiquitinyl hydrolase 1 n=1 Tax=Ambrosiozyma monospora TaxID=43982 RepID=A0A9W6Z3H7_AMBMO|nr:unnamed protein product [Ambrosiozyma monospora]
MGATCYLNSLLQSYFFTKKFRNKVYQIPTEDELNLNIGSFGQYLEQPKSVSLALQRIFYKLQTSDKPLDTMELTQSFGWTGADAFTQHDVQELNRILMDRLETKMKGTEIEGCLNDIFVGKMKSFIRCINVDYESSRTEDFWDIQLNVKGLKNIKDSFANYIASELMDGDNKYDASGYGLQDAEKGVVFESFPPVLHLQLKRFEYDFEYDQLVKVNDRYEFFNDINLKPYLDKEAEGYVEDWTYQLHGVLVHQGDVSMGHYYAMIRPTAEDHWFRFDDDKVWRVTPSDVFEGNFGADKLNVDPRRLTRDEQQEYTLKRHTSAYMLVYMRKSKLNDLLAETETKDIPQHIVKQITYEHDQYQKLRKEQEEMHLYANFKIYTNHSFSKFCGFDLGPNTDDKFHYAEDLYDTESHPLKFRLYKTDLFSHVYDEVCKLLGKASNTQPEHLRFWNISARKNGTDRPLTPLPYDFSDEKFKDVTIEDIIKEIDLFPTRRRYNRGTQLSFFLEDSSYDLKFLSNSVYSLKTKHALPSHIDSIKDISEKLEKEHELVISKFSCKLPVVTDSTNLIMIKFFDLSTQKNTTDLL